jgi:hypothetical protein
MHANLGDHERLDFPSVGDVRSNAQIDHRSTTVNSRGRAIGNFSLNEVFLVFIILQMYHQRDRKSNYRLLNSRRTFPVIFLLKRQGAQTFDDL